MSDNFLRKTALKLRPDLADAPPLEVAGSLADVYGVLVIIFPALLGLIGLFFKTDVTVFQQNWLLLLFSFVLTAILIQYLDFTIQMEVVPGAFAMAGGSLAGIIIWSTVLLVGPAALWLPIIQMLINFPYRIWRTNHISSRWNLAANGVNAIATTAWGGLAGLWVYERLGGVIPLPGLTAANAWTATAALLTVWLVGQLFFAPYLWYLSGIKALDEEAEAKHDGAAIARFLFISSNIEIPVYPFAILLAGLYTLHGPGVYLALVAGIIIVSLLANRLSRAVVRQEQRARELASLEKLGRAIIDTLPGELDLSEILNKFMLSMLPNQRVFIWLEPDDTLILQRREKPFPRRDEAKGMIRSGKEPHYHFDLSIPSRNNAPPITHYALAVPIQNDDNHILGGIYAYDRRHKAKIMPFLPALQSLAAQIAAALHREVVYEQTLASEKMARELEVAGRIQNSFLPDKVPDEPGWQITATLVAALQTSGDFYDFIPLGNGRLGILVADVADKGTGAALYMALSRTLIRTYAMQYPTEPERALDAANARILADTKSDQFVTVFYGVLELGNGMLTYCNAGHNPAYLLGNKGQAVQALAHTGIPLGMFNEMEWRQNSVQMQPGDTLLIYSDGVTEAQNAALEEFEDRRLLDAGRQYLHNSAVEMQDGVITAVSQFVGDAPQFDDITLLVVMRD